MSEYLEVNDDAHVDELTELYALGALEPHERVDVEAHIARCGGCARRLRDAEMTVAALDDTFVPMIEPPARLGARIAASAETIVPFAPRRAATRPPVRMTRAAIAAAAALIFAAGAGGMALLEHAADVGQAEHESAVLATIATSHFSHVTLTPRTAGAPVTKVLFARDGTWFYVVVAGAACHCRVRVRSSSGERDLGPPQTRGTTATLFVRDVERPRAIELIDAAGRVVSAATLR